MSDLEEFVFRGSSPQECEDFIRFVRRNALSKGNQSDNNWIAHFASSCFAGTALRWFEGLDETVQDDWRMLRKAMLERWPDDAPDDLVENLSAISLAPDAPAAAPPPIASRLSKVLLPESSQSPAKRGYIRVEGSPFNPPEHLSCRRDRQSFLTTNRTKNKMLVEVEVGSAPHKIRILNVDGCTWLAVKWRTVVSLETGTKRATGLVGLDEFGKFPTEGQPATWTGPHTEIVWSVGMDGTLMLFGKLAE